jgi:hypothetical protein
MPVAAIIPLAAIVCSTFVAITVLQLIARFIAQRRVPSQALPNEEIARRLERIEQMVESTSIEVERIGESNRFVAKLLAERTDAPLRTNQAP